MSEDSLNLNKAGINKQVFKNKLLRKDGLIVQIHHTVKNQGRQETIRFILASFDKEGHILAAANPTGNIYFVDFVHNKFWIVPNRAPCTALKFSNYNNVEVITGINDGSVYIFNTDSGEITGELLSHTNAVTKISFSRDYMCLTSTKSESIVWDLRSNTKLQVLKLEGRSLLKHIIFMPISNNVLACFEDDTVTIWKYPTFEIFKQILPSSWNKQPLKSIAFTRNGRAMVFGGYSSYLSVFLLDTWEISKVVKLPNHISAVKKINFIPQLFDGGSNRILGILSSNGILYFFDMEQSEIINQIAVGVEINKFYCSFDGQHLACILSSGEINIYKVTHYVPSYSSISVFNKKESATSKTVITTVKKSSSLLAAIQNQIKEVLDLDKLRAILKEFGQYPDSYRCKIWSQLLDLPGNNEQYNSYINHLARASFENLKKDYPLENKVALKNLRKVLCNLVTWAPFFAHISYLPLLVFPFVKVFQNQPVFCFEAVCTIILNWCQHWFEYFPLPPVNVLAMVENLLVEHDPHLLIHFQAVNITSKVYAWSLLEVVFSEVLTTPDWCKLWDHILTNEPAFLLMSVVAYNILHRHALLSMTSQKDFELFYHNQNVIDMKRLIAKSYTLLHNTDEKNHPRQYLNAFKPLEVGAYPPFLDFPKSLVDFDIPELDTLKEEQESLQKDQEEILKERLDEQHFFKGLNIQEEENKRQRELEKICKQKIHEERERVKDQRKRLFELRKQLNDEQMRLFTKSREKVIENNNKERRRFLENIITDMEHSRTAEELEIMKAESSLIKQYSELLRQKIHLEQSIHEEPTKPEPATQLRVLRNQQKQLAQELEKVQKENGAKTQLKHLNIATAISAMDNLIVKIELELAEQMANSYGSLVKDHSSIKTLRLQAETKELELHISKLLGLLSDMKSQETKEKLTEFHKCVDRTYAQPQPQGNHLIRQQQSNEAREKISSLYLLGDNYKTVKKLIGNTQDGYTARPTSPVGENVGIQCGISDELAVVSLTHS